MHAAILVLAHKRMRDEVEEDVGEKAPRLRAFRVETKSAPHAHENQTRTGGVMSAVRMRTAKAVIVLRVFGLICAGMNARMKFGTLLIRQSQGARREGNNVSSDGRRADGC